MAVHMLQLEMILTRAYPRNFQIRQNHRVSGRGLGVNEFWISGSDSADRPMGTMASGPFLPLKDARLKSES